MNDAQKREIIEAVKDSYKNYSQRKLKELLREFKKNPEYYSVRIKAIEEVVI